MASRLGTVLPPSTAREVGGRGSVAGDVKREPRLAMALALAMALTACAASTPAVSPSRGAAGGITGSSAHSRAGLNPSVANHVNVYAAALSGFAPAVRGITARVYVPNVLSNTVDVIDPVTLQIVAQYKVGSEPQHITPSWDLTKLYVDQGIQGGNLTVIDPRIGRTTGVIPNVPDPYNLYFTPDGTKALVVAEDLHRIDFRDPHTWKLIRSVSVPWPGVDHLDFTADGRYVLASTEYAGVLVKIDTVKMKVVSTLRVGGLPIDVRLAPDGSVFYVANQGRSGVHIIDPVTMKQVGFLHTGRGAHGLVVSRDTKSIYVANRLAGTISVIDAAKRTVVATWRVGGSPDMMQVSPDGNQLWFSNRFSGFVTVLNPQTGKIIKKIMVGVQPHGLCYFPQPGRFSLGHNGVYR
jgi:YVTN family beta-propeller protein